MLPTTYWMAHGRCQENPPSSSSSFQRTAAGCRCLADLSDMSSSEACLEHALQFGILNGVWGGMSE